MHYPKNKKPYLIYIYPYKFTEFNFYLAELEDYSTELEVEVWDLSPMTTSKFANAISQSRSLRKEVVLVKTIKHLIIKLKQIRQISESNIVLVQNELISNSMATFFSSLVFFLMVRKTNIKILDFYNFGVPLYYENEGLSTKSIVFNSGNFLFKISSIKEFYVRIIHLFFNAFRNLFSSIHTYRLVAGSQWLEYQLNNKKLGSIELVYGHSNDYSKFIAQANNSSRNKTAVFLDSAGPAFASDSALSGRKVFFTSEQWYPALSSFFNFFESQTSLDVKILGHYKSDHISPSPLFGGREVVYGETAKMVQKADYVITRNSTAISFAVVYRKPVIIVYSNQLLKDKEAMECINGFANMLGTKPINIDEDINNLDDLLVINEEKYLSYIDSILSSNKTNLTNCNIILDKIFNIKPKYKKSILAR
jgi:hypothetical protein